MDVVRGVELQWSCTVVVRRDVAPLSCAARIPAWTGILVLCHRAVQCSRATHGLPHCAGTGVPWVSLPGTTSVPADAQAGWHRRQSANSVLCLCLCCVVVARAVDNLELWSCKYRC